MNLISILGNKSQLKILDFLMDKLPKEISQKDIIKKTKIAKGTAIKGLSSLKRDSIINLKKIGVTNLYSLKENSPIVKQLKITKSLISLFELNISPSY